MMNLTSFRGQSRIINVATEIGMQYITVGMALLNDRFGGIVPQIVTQSLNNIELVNVTILSRWIQGSGMEDRSWSGLLRVLRESGCAALSKEIEEALAIPTHTSN